MHDVNPNRQGGEEKPLPPELGPPPPVVGLHVASWRRGGVKNASELAGMPSVEAARRRGGGYTPPARFFNDGGDLRPKVGVRCPGGVSFDPEDPEDVP